MERQPSVQTYTLWYDAIVAGIRRWAPTGSAALKFMGLGSKPLSYVEWHSARRASRRALAVTIARIPAFQCHTF